MAHRRRAGWGMLLVLAAAGPASRPAPPPVLEGPALPVPHRQHDPWPRPATTLPALLVDDTALLFDQGMADPRGGEYRAVGVVTGDGQAGVAETHAWVLPGTGPSAQRFAVCWNGLVYPCVTVGAPADLAADVRGLLDADRQERAAWERTPDHRGLRFRRWTAGHDAEAASVAATSVLPIKACLLLRAGEPKLAEAYWPAVADVLWPHNDDGNAPPDDPYQSLSQDWAWYAFDRAVCAHTRGDDVVGRDTAELLSAALPKVESTDAAKHIERPTHSAVDNRDLDDRPYIGFVKPLPELLADERRRTAEGPVRRVLDDPRQYPDQPKRIAALVRDLEVASAEYIGPGSQTPVETPVAQALIHEGDPAVDALIACVAGDDRLTRSVSSGPSDPHWQYLYPTSRLAFDTLRAILQVDRFGPATSNGFDGRTDRSTVADEVRAYHAKGSSPAQRWYATLADDAAGPARWVEAAGRIAEPTVVYQVGPWVTVPDGKPGARPPMTGESLRAIRNPSVSELLARRASAIAAEDGVMGSASSQAVDVAVDLYRWDATAAVPVLRAQLQRYLDDNWLAGTDQVDEAARDIGRLTMALAAAGDREGVRRYAAWIVRQGPATAGHNVGDLLQPIWRYPDNADLAAAGTALSNAPDSPWQQLAAVPTFSDSDVPSLYAGAMYGLPGFRQRVRSDLENQAVIGSAQVKDGDVVVAIDGRHGGVTSWGRANLADPLLPRSGDAKVPIRVCDWCAWKVSQLGGAPPFEVYWPQAKRDVERERLVDFLNRWGDRLRCSPARPGTGPFAAGGSRMTFPRRDVPATPDDVWQATAIFTLAGGPVRVVPLPTWPASAKWVTSKDYPVRYRGTQREAGATEPHDGYLNVGLVWQAEEVQIGGRWHRYYGFVGPHTVTRVAAEEIKFVAGP